MRLKLSARGRHLCPDDNRYGCSRLRGSPLDLRAPRGATGWYQAHLGARCCYSARGRVAGAAPLFSTYAKQRIPYRLRHEARAGLRTDLAHLVTAESAFLADSGHPAVNLPLSYGFSVDPGTTVSVRIRIDGWDATVQSMYTPIRCSGGLDIPDGSRIQLPKPIDCVGEHETRP